MGSVAWSGQMQQMPVGRGAEIIRREWWQLWASDEFPPYGTCVASLDTAYKEHEEADYNALTVWAAFEHPETGKPKLMLVQAWQVRCNLAELVQRVVRSCRGLQPVPPARGEDEPVGPKVERLLIEDVCRRSRLQSHAGR